MCIRDRAVLLELAPRAQQLGSSRSEGESLALEEGIRAILPIPFHQLGFVIKKIEVRRRTGQVKINDALGPSAKLGSARAERIGRRLKVPGQGIAQQGEKRGGTQPAR